MLRAARRRLSSTCSGSSPPRPGRHGLRVDRAGERLLPLEAVGLRRRLRGRIAVRRRRNVGAGDGWPAIVVLTALVNARHILYAAALSPWLRDRPRRERALMAHVLTDEAFALSLVHFRRLGFADRPGYWLAAIGGVFIPWNLATLIGVLGGQMVPDRRVLGLDVVFPAAMAGSRSGWPRAGGRSPRASPGSASPSPSGWWSTDERRPGGGLVGPFVGLLVPRRDPAVPEPDELPAEPGAFSRPGRSDDGIAP